MTKIVLPIPNAAPLTITSQPKGDYNYVSSEEDTVTQFSMPQEKGGSLAYLAHNTAAGKLFDQLKVGDMIGVKSDVPTTRGGYAKKVSSIKKYQAVNPRNPSSDFIDLETGERLTADALYKKMYTDAGNLILQTCISKDGDDSWGRLFVIAGDE